MIWPSTYVLLYLAYVKTGYGDVVDCEGELLDDDRHYLPLFVPQAIRVRLNCECKGKGPCNELKKGYMIQVTQFGATNPKTASYTKKKFNVGDTVDQPIFAEYTENVLEQESFVSIVDKNSDVKVGPGKKYKIGYRICGLSEKCKQTASKNCQNKFCLLTGKEEKACLDLDASVCQSTHGKSSPYQVCSVSDASESNLCTAVSKNKPMHYMSTGGPTTYCDKSRSLEIKSKDGKPIAMNEYVKVTRTTNEFNVVCGSAFGTGKIKCRLHNHNGENLKADFDTTCNKPFSVSDAELKKRGSLRVTCHVQSGDIISKTFFKIIYLDEFCCTFVSSQLLRSNIGKLTIMRHYYSNQAELVLTGPDSKCSAHTLKFECQFANSESMTGFTFSYKAHNALVANDSWTTSSGALKVSYPKHGDYTCEATAVYLTCDPSQRIEFSVKKNLAVTACEHTEEYKRSVQGVPPASSQFYYYIVVAGCLIVVIILIIIITMIQLKKRGVIGVKRWFNQDLRIECAACSQCLCKEADKVGAAKEVADDKAAETTFLQVVLDPKMDDVLREKSGTLVSIKSCLSPEILCLKKTMVRLQPPEPEQSNVNFLFDFRMMPIYMGQLQQQAEFKAFWRMVDELKICVVVWFVESFGEVPLPFPNKPNVSQKYGNVSVKNVAQFAFADIFKVYEVQFINTNQKKLTPTTMDFIEISKWPVNDVPGNAKEISKILDEVEFYETKHRRVDPKRRGIMALCRTGTRESATFLSVHIARQMYLVHREVNPIGVMRYIRRHRHGAFTKTAKPPAQLKIVYGMLQNALLNIEQSQEKVVGTVPAGGESLYSTKIDNLKGESTVKGTKTGGGSLTASAAKKTSSSKAAPASASKVKS